MKIALDATYSLGEHAFGRRRLFTGDVRRPRSSRARYRSLSGSTARNVTGAPPSGNSPGQREIPPADGLLGYRDPLPFFTDSISGCRNAGSGARSPLFTISLCSRETTAPRNFGRVCRSRRGKPPRAADLIVAVSAFTASQMESTSECPRFPYPRDSSWRAASCHSRLPREKVVLCVGAIQQPQKSGAVWSGRFGRCPRTGLWSSRARTVTDRKRHCRKLRRARAPAEFGLQGI